MTRTTRRLLGMASVLAASGAVAFACGGSSDNEGGAGAAGSPAQPIAQGDFASKLADAVCSNVSRCCTDNGYGFDQTKCSEGMKSIGQQYIDGAGSSSGVTYDATAAGNCAAQYQAIATSCVFGTEAEDALAKACDAIWSGTRTEGQPCTDWRECAGSADGTIDCVAADPPSGDAGAQRICAKTVTPVHGAKGDPCDATCEVTAGGGKTCSSSSGAPEGARHCWLQDGLTCDVTTYQCVDLIAEGQPCTSMSRCVATAYCKGGTCTARIAIGSPCEVSGLADPCQSGAWCNVGSKNCETLKTEGEACTSFQECASSRCHGGKCIAENAAASDGLCGSK